MTIIAVIPDLFKQKLIAHPQSQAPGRRLTPKYVTMESDNSWMLPSRALWM